jgi:steroid delta-isomerase-like uncharacterized protein
MSTEENKALARRWAEEIFNQGNLDAADELFGPGFITRHLDAPDLDREGWKEFSRPFISGFSERRLAVEDLVAEEEEVVGRVTFSGKHTGEFFGIPPTDRRVEFTGMVWFRIAEGKIVEHWGEFDALGLLRQLGAVPDSGQ